MQTGQYRGAPDPGGLDLGDRGRPRETTPACPGRGAQGHGTRGSRDKLTTRSRENSYDLLDLNPAYAR